MVVHTYNPGVEESGAERLPAWLKEQNPISKEEDKNNKQTKKNELKNPHKINFKKDLYVNVRECFA